MARDKNDNELKIDDNVTVACVVTGIDPDDSEGNSRIHVQTAEKHFPDEHKTNIKLSSRQVALADTLFDEAMSEKLALAEISDHLYQPSARTAPTVAEAEAVAANAPANAAIKQLVLQSHLAVLNTVLSHRGVKAAVRQARAAGVSWGDILAAIIPLILGVFSGGTLDWAAIIAAIMALFNRPTPTV